MYICTCQNCKISFINLGVNVFGLWKHNFWRNILHTESNNGGKSSRIFGRISLPSSGMVTSGRWCHMTRLDPVTPVGGWQPVRTSPLSSSNWCQMIQKGNLTPTATSYHPLTKAEIFCRKFGNFFHHYLSLCVGCFIRNLLLSGLSWDLSIPCKTLKSITMFI